MSPTDAQRSTHPSLAANLTRRLAWIAGAVTLANVIFVAVYYGSDREALEAEVVRREMARLEAALLAAPDAAPWIGADLAHLFEAHPHAYAYALLDADGRVLEQMNPALIPAPALTTGMFADDWLARRPGPRGERIVASHVIRREAEELRLVFVMDADPAGLTHAAIFSEFVGHIWLPLAPIALLLIGANALMIRRGLAPLGEAAAWARAVRPGLAPPPFASANLPAEIADLADATLRLHARLDAALAAEKRRAAEAAHALRTPWRRSSPGSTHCRPARRLIVYARTSRPCPARCSSCWPPPGPTASTPRKPAPSTWNTSPRPSSPSSHPSRSRAAPIWPSWSIPRRAPHAGSPTRSSWRSPTSSRTR